MSDSKRLFPLDEVGLGHRLRASQNGQDGEPSARHDELILKAAREAGRAIGRRHNRKSLKPLLFPTSIAASLLLGIVLGRSPWPWHERSPSQAHLTIPAGLSVRGQSPTPTERLQIPVEEADPSAWYRYIQELVFSGQTEAAEQHLRRFRELHPDFIYQP